MPNGPMHEVSEWLALGGIKLVSLIAGFFGATVALMRTPRLTTAQLFTSVFSGALVGNYGEPLVSQLLNLPPGLQGAVAFFIGLTGMMITAGFIEVAGALPAIVVAWIKRIAGVT